MEQTESKVSQFCTIRSYK